MTVSNQLIDAYQNTTFTAWTPEQIDIRIGQMSATLDNLFDRTGESCWAFITAYNPGSRPTHERQNVQRQAELNRAVCNDWPHVYPGSGAADTGDWPPDPSVLVLGIPEDQAIEVGREYGQVAIVTGRRGEPAKLALCDPLEPLDAWP